MKIFEFNKGQSGTLIDSVSKTAGSLTTGSGGFRKTERGQAMLFDGSATKIIYDGVASGTTFSFVSYIGKVKSTGTYQVIAGNNTNGAYFTSISDSDSLYFNNGTHAVTVANSGVLNSGKNHIVIVTVNGNQVSFYVDNIQIGTTQTISSIISIDLKSIGKRSTDLSFNGYIGLVRLYNTVLTTTQRNELYKEFLNSYGTEKQKRNFEYPKPTDLSSEVDSKVGTNLTDNYDFTSGWTDIAISSTTTNSFTTTSVGGLQKDILTIGKKYKIYYNATTTASDTGVNVGISEVCGNGEYAEFTATATALYVRNSNAGTTTVNNLTVQEITGLVAAYSFSPETVKGGVLTDISGNGNNGTISGALLTKDGMKFDGVDDTIESINNTGISGSQARTVVLRVRVPDENITVQTLPFSMGTALSDKIFAIRTDVGDNWKFTDASAAYDTGVKVSKEFQSIVLSFNSSKQLSVYIDGSLTDVDAESLTSLDTTDTHLFIGSYLNTSSFFNGEIQDLKIYNYAFTPQEAARYHNSFIRPTLIESFENHPVGSIANPQGTGVYSVSEKVIEQGELVSNGDFSSGTTDWTLTDCNGDVDTFFGRDNSLELTATNAVTVYMNQSGLLTVGKRFKIAYWYYIPSTNTSCDNIIISDLVLALTNRNTSSEIDTWTYDEFEFSSFNDDRLAFVMRDGTSTTVTVGDKIYLSDISVVEIPPLPSLTTGTKELTCGTGGTFPIQSKQAYGEFSFNVNKGADGNVLSVPFIAGSVSGYNGADSYYQVNLVASEQLILRKANTGNLFTTANSYIANNTDYRIKVARLKSAGVFKDIPTLQTSDCVNSTTFPYTSFTSNGRYGFSAISNGSGIQVAGSSKEISAVNTVKYLVEFNLKLNSGTLPSVAFTRINDVLASNVVSCINGRNSIIITSIYTGSVSVNMYNSSTATDYEISGLTIRRIYDADTFAVFIKGGAYGNTETGWTLVDTTGGSGSNPVVSSDYTESSYFVADLDQNDKISGISIKSDVRQ